jgi:nucleoside phosphorylase/tetratricopeptide (TPR) repeat protein
MAERPGRAVILTALGLEYDAVRAWLTDPQLQVHRSGTRYERGRLTDADAAWEVVLAEIGAGNQAAATLTSQAIDTFDPDLVLFVGIAGSLVNSVQLGDVVAATRVDAYHGGKVVARRFVARPVTWPAAWPLEQAARQVSRERRWLERLGEPPAQLAETLAAWPPQVHLKPILAGEVIVDSRESRLYRFLREHYNDAVAVEMEGAGLATAAHASGAVPAMVIRGISDLAGGAKQDTDAAGWQPRAAAHAAAFTVELLVNLDPSHLPSRRQAPEERLKEEPPHPAVFELRGHERLTTFTGRDDVLKQLHDTLESATGPAAVLALHGLGGVGKTQLAVEYAHRYRGHYDVVWWLRAEIPLTAAQDYAALAGSLGLPEAGQPDVKVVRAAVRAWLAGHDRWLLLVDNAQDDQVLPGLLPDPLRGHVLVTSRNPVWRRRAYPIWIDVFPPDEAVRFLLDRTGQDDQARATEVAEALGYLPLALDQAGAYMELTGLSLSDFLARLRDSESRALAEGYAADERQVATVWKLSLVQVNEDAPAAADLLNLLAFLAPDDLPRNLLGGLAQLTELPEALATAAADPFTLDQAIGVLRRFSLVHTEHQVLSVHRLVQAVTRHGLPEPDQATWAAITAKLVNNALPIAEYETWQVHERLLPHALAVIDHTARLQVALAERVRLLNEVGRYLQQRAHLNQARSCLEQSLALAETGGATDTIVAIVLSNLAALLRELGDPAAARPLAERALAIAEAALGPDHPDVATRLSNLAAVLRDLGDPAAARPLLERSLTIAEAAYGPDHPDVANHLNNLATVLQDLGDPAAARPLAERSLTITEAALGPTHPAVANRLSNLALVLQDLGDPAAARPLLERALAIAEAAYGPDHPDVAIRLNNLALVLWDLGDPAAARPLAERALAITEVALGPDHPTVATLLSNLALVLQDLGDPAAAALLERARQIREGGDVDSAS